MEATICYLKAEQWQEAHNVLVSHLLADFILQKGNIDFRMNLFVVIINFINCFFFFLILEGKKKLKYLLSWLIDGSKVDGSIPAIMQDSSTMLEYLKLNNEINKMSAEQSILHIASLCERVACFPENTIEER